MFDCPDKHTLCLDCFMQYCEVQLTDRQFEEHPSVGYTLRCPAKCEGSEIKESHHFRIMGPDKVHSTCHTNKHTHTHTHTHTCGILNYIYQSHTHTLSLTHTHTLSLSLTHTLSLSHTHTHTLYTVRSLPAVRYGGVCSPNGRGLVPGT